MIEWLIKAMYSLNSFIVIGAGVIVITRTGAGWIATLSSSIMVLAAMVSLYALWNALVRLEFIATWFIGVGLGAYVGFAWLAVYAGESSFTRGAVSSMALTLLVAKGLSLWRLVLQINTIEQRIENNG